MPTVSAPNFKRGFKTWAENTAVSVRSRVKVAQYAPLSPYELAANLNVRIWTPEQVPGIPTETVRYLASDEGDEWSAITLQVGSISLVVVNSNHSPARQGSDLMHELAHVLCNHEPARIVIASDTGARIRSFDDKQEAEADWLAGCLLLPRTALVYCASRQWSDTMICTHYGVSPEMYTYRKNITGIARQFRS